ncbi:MAG TPA: ABC transporter permease [Candidatus Saccharimonadales bacterium]|nr:ABC transporter permease [Candidatus Saccharimonadales bacterium]
MASVLNTLRDTVTMTGRTLKHSLRNADTITTVVVMPLFIMAMFVYIFGSSIKTGSLDYVNYIVPGIVLMCIANGAAYAAFRLNNDITKGIINRFRTMPIAKSAVLGGHVVSSTLFSLISAVVVFGAAMLMGFHPGASVEQWALVGLLLFIVSLGMSWLSMVFGLLAKSAEGASAFSYVLLLMIFLSSAFAPTSGMNSIVRFVAEHQPMTPVLDAMRALLAGTTPGQTVVQSLIWTVGLLVVSYILAMWVYARRSVRG